MSTLGIFHGTASGRQTQDDAFLNHLTVANSATLNCTTLTASDNINCSALRVVGGDVELCNIKCSSILTILSKDNMNLISDLGNLTVNANKNITLVSDAGNLEMEADQDISLLASNNSIQLTSFQNTTIESVNANVQILATAGQIAAEGADGVLKIGAGIGLSSDAGNIDLNLSGGTGDINIVVSGGGTTFINGDGTGAGAGRLAFFAGTGVPSQLAGAAIGAVTGGQPLSADVQDIANTLNSLRNGLINYGLFFP